MLCDASHSATACDSARWRHQSCSWRTNMTALALNTPDQHSTTRGLDDHRGYGRLGFAAIALVFGGFGVWATFAPLDKAAVAQGQVSVESNNKPVQHLEGGIVREILVRDAQQVKEGY